MLSERRRAERTRVAQPAKIYVSDLSNGHDCVVDDLSTSGACVSFDREAVAILPDQFDLTFDNCRTFWDCRVVWQNRHVGRVGVTWKLA